mgnify:FL=1
MLKEKYNVHVHDYHKSERMGRKLGHITYTCEKDGQLSEDISAIKKILQ